MVEYFQEWWWRRREQRIMIIIIIKTRFYIKKSIEPNEEGAREGKMIEPPFFLFVAIATTCWCLSLGVQVGVNREGVCVSILRMAFICHDSLMAASHSERFNELVNEFEHRLRREHYRYRQHKFCRFVWFAFTDSIFHSFWSIHSCAFFFLGLFNSLSHIHNRFSCVLGEWLPQPSSQFTEIEIQRIIGLKGLFADFNWELFLMSFHFVCFCLVLAKCSLRFSDIRSSRSKAVEKKISIIFLLSLLRIVNHWSRWPIRRRIHETKSPNEDVLHCGSVEKSSNHLRSHNLRCRMK